MKDYRITVALTTGLTADSKGSAKEQVMRTILDGLGVNIEIGTPGEVLPFEITALKAKRLPKGY